MSFFETNEDGLRRMNLKIKYHPDDANNGKLWGVQRQLITHDVLCELSGETRNMHDEVDRIQRELAEMRSESTERDKVNRKLTMCMILLMIATLIVAMGIGVWHGLMR